MSGHLLQNKLCSVGAELEKDWFKGVEIRELNDTKKFCFIGPLIIISRLFQGSMSYEDLIHGLIYNGETIISYPPHLQYMSMTVTDENGSVVDTKVGGVAMLTDKRLLLLSSQYFHSKYLFSQFI